MDIIKCECGIIITEEQDLYNNKVAKKTNTPKLNMCAECWANYCDHVVTGE